MEPATNLMALRELVKLMQNESGIDFRNTLLDPPVPMNFFKGGLLGGHGQGGQSFTNGVGHAGGIYDGLTFIRATQCQCYFILWEDINS